MRSVYVKNNKLMAKTFWDSIDNLMSLDSFDGKTTLALFRVRKELVEKVEDVSAVMKGRDANSVREILDTSSCIEVDLTLDFNKLSEKLSANDLFQLEQLFQEEEL